MQVGRSPGVRCLAQGRHIEGEIDNFSISVLQLYPLTHCCSWLQKVTLNLFFHHPSFFKYTFNSFFSSFCSYYFSSFAIPFFLTSVFLSPSLVSFIPFLLWSFLFLHDFYLTLSIPSSTDPSFHMYLILSFFPSVLSSILCAFVYFICLLFFPPMTPYYFNLFHFFITFIFAYCFLSSSCLHYFSSFVIPLSIVSFLSFSCCFSFLPSSLWSFIPFLLISSFFTWVLLSFF